MDAAIKAKFDVLETAGYLPAVRERAKNLAVPFWWHGENPGPYRILGNGTVCLVSTGKRYIAITAAHVYRGYQEHKASHRVVIAQFGGIPIVPEERLIECNDTLDLATFVISENLARLTGHALYRAPQWPPKRSEQGELFVYGGYPGILREIHPDNTAVDFPFQTFIGWRFGDLTNDNIVLDVDYPNLHWPGHEGEPINTQPGGISGGPVYRLTETFVPEVGLRWRLDLIGIVWEYYEPWQTMRARHVDVVAADGSLTSICGRSLYGGHFRRRS